MNFFVCVFSALIFCFNEDTLTNYNMVVKVFDSDYGRNLSNRLHSIGILYSI
jgi:hypothetical protein